MNDGHGLTKENLLRSLPPALAADKEMLALAECIAQLLEKRPEEMERTLIYPRTGELDGPLLDLLAQDFKIDWWDSELGLEEKRRTLQTSWQVHKLLGTKAAVEKAASAAYPRTVVSEWFEYGGEPYHFRLDVGLGETEWNQERHKKLMWGLNFYKNLRSHLDAVEYHMEPIRLENRQAFYFAALTITLKGAPPELALRFPVLTFHLGGVGEQVQAAFPAFRVRGYVANGNQLAMTVNLGRTVVDQRRYSQFAFCGLKLLSRQKNRGQATLPALRLGCGAENREATALSLRYLARVQNWGQEQIRLDGRRRLDGTWQLNQHLEKGILLVGIRFRAGAINRQSVAARFQGEPLD